MAKLLSFHCPESERPSQPQAKMKSRHPFVPLFQLVVPALFCTASIAATDQYTKALFVQGLQKGGFVLISLRNPKDGSERRVCTLESALLGAIHRQHHIDYDAGGRKRAEEIALQHWDKPFTFTNPQALKNVEPTYKPVQLKEVTKRLSKYDKATLSKELDDPYGAIHSIYTNPYRESYRDAVAQVLLENGIPVGVDDRTPLLRPLQEGE
jgi:hypothetical protein